MDEDFATPVRGPDCGSAASSSESESASPRHEQIVTSLQHLPAHLPGVTFDVAYGPAAIMTRIKLEGKQQRVARAPGSPNLNSVTCQ